MRTSVRPDEDELDRALASIRAKKPEVAQPSIDDALASIRKDSAPAIQTPPMRLRPVVVSKPEAPPKPMIAAQPDVTRVGADPVGLEEQLRNEHPTLLDATVQGVKGMVEHPIDTGIELAKTPFKGGQAVGEYVKGGRLNKGKGRAAAIGAAQTAAMLLGGPAEKLAEPIAARLVGEAAAPLISRTAVGAATGATFSPDRPAVGAIIGGAAGAISSRGVADAKLAERQARFEELARQHPEWFGESTPAAAETRANRILDNPQRPKAQARVAEPEPVQAEPDFTVDEPIIEQKGVFGGALEQHGKAFAEGKVAPTVPPADMSTKPAENVNKNVNFAPLPSELPSTVDEVDAAMDANADRYSKATDPAERRHILQLQELLEDHRAAIAPPEPEHKFSSTQLDLPEESSAAIKEIGATIPDHDLAPDGREERPHITVKYGLHGEDPEAVRQLLANEPPITVKLGKTSFFPNGESENGDVVKVDVDSPELHKLNKKIATAMPHTDTHPEYKPHVTIAYVRPGLGKRYEGNASLEGHTMTFDRLTFSGKDGAKHEIVLGGKVKPVVEKKLGKNVLRSPTWDDAKKDLTLDTTAEMDEVRSAARMAGFDGLVVNGEHVDLRKPKEPVHESARVPSGGLRDNFETVKDDGLIKEMFELLGAEDPSDSIRAIYRTVEADVSGTQFGVMIQAATRKGSGPSEQAKALHRMELKKGVAGRIERILNARGLTDEQITRRYAELVELEAERAAEVEGLDNEDHGDTSFEFGEEGYTNEHGEGAGRAVAEAEGTKPPAESGAGRSAADAGPRAGKGTPTSKAEPSEVARQESGAAMDDIVAKMRSGGREPQRNGYDQAVHDLWKEAGTNGRLELLDQWRRIYPEQDFFPEWADRAAEDLPQHVREKIGMERVKQGVALKDLGALQRPDEDWRAPNEKTFSPVAKGLANGVPLSVGTQMYDTEGNATKATLDKLAQKPYTRQLATRFTAVFDQIHAAIAKRHTFEPVRYGGFDVSMGAVGMNVKPRAGGGNFILTNPYAALMEVGLSGRLRSSEYAAALSERTFATMVHEIAHQPARGHDELFSSYLTRYAGAAAPIAHLVLPELDQAWQVALENGFKDDLVTVQHEVWNHELNRDIARPEPTEGSPDRLSLGVDADASYLRPSEGDGGFGEGDGRRRLHVRPDVRGSEAGRSDEGSGSAEPVRRRRLGEKRPGEANPEGEGSDGVAVTAAAGRFNKVVDDVRKMFAPASRGPLAREAANITREQVARMAHENEIARHRLSEFAKAFSKLPRETRLDFIDRMENSRPQANEQLSDAAYDIREMLDAARDAVRRLGTGHLENFIANYFPHIWSKPEEAGRIINQITGKRPLEGTRSFLKRRTIPTLKEGMELGLEPISTNPVDLSLLKIREMNRYIMGQRLMRALKDDKLVQFVDAFAKAPEGYARINDHVAMVYGPPTVPVAEAFDALVRKQLVDVMKSLGVEHMRPIKIKGLRSVGGGQVWGVAEGDKRIQAKFGGDATIIMHELGHILDHRYKLWDKLVERVAKRPNDKARLAKNRGKMVADQSHPSNSEAAKKRRTTIKKELRALADLRFEGDKPEDIAQGYKDYVREKPEQIANAVHAYIYAKAKMKRVAPTVYDVLDGIVQGDSKLKPLADIEPSVRLGSGTNETSAGGLVVKGQYWAPEQVANIINNYLSPGLRGNSIYDAYMGVGNLMNSAQLGLSAFHLGFTSMEASVSRVALSLRHLASGRPLSAARTFASSPAAPVTNFLRGRKLREAYLNPDRSNAEMTQIVDALVAGGGRIRMDDFYKTGAIEGLKHALDEHNPWGVAWRAFPALVELTVKPILEYVVPRQKMGVFFDHAKLEIEKLGKNPDPADVRRAMAEQWDSVDNRMGQLVYDNLFWNKVGKDLAMASVRAVGWNLGTIREIGGGLADFTTSYKRWKQGEEVFTTKMSYVVALPIFVGMVGALYTYLATGEPPKELKDYYFPRTGRIGPDGNPERVTLPSYIKDVYHYGKKPIHTIESKLHPAIEAIVEMLHNEDFYGTMIVDPDAPLPDKVKEYGKFMARTFTPFGIRNAIDAESRGQSRTTQALNFIGITPAPRELVRTPAQNRMSEYLARHAPESRTPAEADKGKLHRDVLKAVRAGEKLPASVNEAMKEGKLKRSTLFDWIQDARTRASVAQFKRLSADEAKKVWELASPGERAIWTGAYRTKLVNAKK